MFHSTDWLFVCSLTLEVMKREKSALSLNLSLRCLNERDYVTSQLDWYHTRSSMQFMLCENLNFHSTYSENGLFNEVRYIFCSSLIFKWTIFEYSCINVFLIIFTCCVCVCVCVCVCKKQIRDKFLFQADYFMFPKTSLKEII